MKKSSLIIMVVLGLLADSSVMASGSFVIAREKKSRFQRPEDLVRTVPFVRNLIDPIPFSKETTVKLQINEVLIQWNPKQASNYSLRLSSRIDHPTELRLTARKRF